MPARNRTFAASAGVVLLVALVLLLGRGLRAPARNAALESNALAGGDAAALESDPDGAQTPDAERAPLSADVGGDSSLALRGFVLDELGAPVAGATVTAAPEIPEVSERAQGATLAIGGFELPVADASSTYRLQVVAEGYFAAFVDGLVPGGAPITVELRAAPSLTGTVFTTAGSSVAGARVRLLAHTSFGEALELESTSDASGRYRLSGALLDLEQLESPLLEASAPGFAPTRVELRDFAFALTRAQGLERLERDLVLSPGNRFTGRVRDEAGAPVAGAELVVFTHSGRGILTDPYGTTRSAGLGPTAIATTMSAADGRFVLEGLPVRTVESDRATEYEDVMGSVRVSAEGFALGGARLPWTEEGEPTEALELVLARGAAFHGRVVDGLGQPLDGAKVGIQVSGASLSTILPYGMLPAGFGELLYWSPPRADAAGYLWVLTGADGRFRSPALPCAVDGQAQVRFQLSWGGEEGAWRELELHAGEARELGDLELALQRVQVLIEGVVQGPDGAAIAGAEVRLQDSGMCRTDRSGTFRFEHGSSLGEAFSSLDLEVRARGFAMHREMLGKRPQGPLEVRLALGGELRGTLRFSDGSPASGGRITFERPREPGQGFLYSNMIGGTRADADGRFAFTELPPPPWLVTYRVSGQGFEREAESIVHEPRTGLALVFPGSWPEFASLELGVTDAGGRPVAVEHAPGLVNEAGRIEALRRDARTFVFPESAPGRYELQVDAPGFARHSQELELAPAERARVEVVLQVGARVRVRVEPPPPSGMRLRVAAQSSAGELRSGAVGDDGVAELGVLRHAAWTVGLAAHASATEARAWRGPTLAFTVAVGESSLEWSLERPALGRVRLELPVHGAADPPIPSDGSSPADESHLAVGDRHQSWWHALDRYTRRAKELAIELRGDADVVVLDLTPEDVELDAARNRVCGTFTAPVGRYTLVLRRGTELLRRAPIQVLPDVTVDLDP